MQAFALTIPKTDALDWVASLRQKGDVIAPVAGPCGEPMFSEIDSPDQILWNFENPLVPPKRFVLPQTDPLVRIQRDDRQTTVSSVADNRRRYLFNVRSCDARGIAFLTRMHETPPPDTRWLRRAANLTVITLACSTPCAQGFCICSDSGPFLRSDFDIQLTEIGKTYLAEIVTEKGAAALAGALPLFNPATEGDIERRNGLEAEARRHFGAQTCHFASAMRRISTGRVDDALWDRMSDWCLECGGCTYICPTCYCFSVRDRGGDGDWTRCRVWDSCQYATFTLEASGHNPRARQRSRMKRRFYHKVSAQYYVRDALPGCVGCGRCTRVCPGAANMPAVVAAIRQGAWHAN